MEKQLVYQMTRPQQDIDGLVSDFIDANEEEIDGMLLAFLDNCGEIQNPFKLSEAEEILCNRVKAKLQY